MFFAASKAVSSVTGPWFWCLLFLACAGLLYRRSRVASAVVAAWAAMVPLLFASPRFADALQRLAESPARDTSRHDVRYDVAVVLGGRDERIAAAGAVMREGRARYVLYSGTVSAADEKRARTLLQAAGVPAGSIVIENHSRNTRENAVESSRIIAERGWRSVLLITSASHVGRALGCFRDLGLNPDVLPADPAPVHRDGWLPRRGVIPYTRAALHELIGRVAYRVAGYTG